MMRACQDRQPVARPVLTILCLLLLAALMLGPLYEPAAAASSNWSRPSQQSQKLSGTQARQVKAVSQRLTSQSEAILRKYGVRRGVCSNASLSHLRAMGSELSRAFSAARSQLSRVLTSAQLKKFTADYQRRRQAEKARIVCSTRSAQQTTTRARYRTERKPYKTR